MKELIAHNQAKSGNEFKVAHKKYFIGANYEIKKDRAASELNTNKERLKQLEDREA